MPLNDKLCKLWIDSSEFSALRGEEVMDVGGHVVLEVVYGDAGALAGEIVDGAQVVKVITL